MNKFYFILYQFRYTICTLKMVLWYQRVGLDIKKHAIYLVSSRSLFEISLSPLSHDWPHNSGCPSAATSSSPTITYPHPPPAVPPNTNGGRQQHESVQKGRDRLGAICVQGAPFFFVFFQYLTPQPTPTGAVGCTGPPFPLTQPHRPSETTNTMRRGENLSSSDAHRVPVGSFWLPRTRTRGKPVPCPRGWDTRGYPYGSHAKYNVLIILYKKNRKYI